MSESDAAGKVIGDYQVKRKLGQGAMGVVYRAWDRQLERDVALKVLPGARAEDPKFIHRLYEEARAAAKINHPHVVTTYAVGEDAGQHYIAMEYVAGRPLDAEIAKVGRMNEPVALELAAQIAEGLDAAHRQRIYHRDIKPHNVMVDENGRARILDFGIARARGGRTSSDAGMLVGTPAYMSPEQCLGQSGDARSDFYSLGVTLYEMLSGKLPHEARTPMELLEKIVSQPPRPVQWVEPRVSDGLARLLDKALAKEPLDRFQTGAEMAQALRDAARKPARVAATDQTGERAGERPGVSADVPAGTGPGVASGRAAPAGRPARGGSASEPDDQPGYRPAGYSPGASATGLKLKPAPPPRTAESAELRLGPRPRPKSGGAWKKWLAAAVLAGAAVAAAPLAKQRLGAGEALRLAGNRSEVFAIAFDAKGERAASGARDGSALLWDLSDAPEPGPLAALIPPSLAPMVGLREARGEATVFSLDLAEGPGLLAAAAGDGSISVWEMATGEKISEFSPADAPLYAVAIAPDGKRILTAGMTADVFLCEAKSGRTLAKLPGHEGIIRAVAVSPAGDLAASGDSADHIFIWSLPGGKRIQSIDAAQGGVTALSFSPDGGRLASGGWNGSTRVWKTAGGTKKFEIAGGNNPVRSVRFSAGGAKLTIAGDGGLIRIVDASTGADLRKIQAARALTFNAAALSANEKRLIAGDSDGRVRVWELAEEGK